MRIGLFTDTYPPYINGVSTSVLMLQKALEKKGHEVFIVTVNAENMSFKTEDNDKIIRLAGIPTGIYDYRLTGIYPLKAVNKVKKWNLDVIHSHTEFGVGTFARIMAKQFDIPLVHTYHTMYEDYVHYITKGYFNGASRKLVEYLTLFYCDKMASELVVPTKKAYDLFKEKYKVDRNVHIVPTGFELDRFDKENINMDDVRKLKDKLNIKEKDFVIIFVGRLGKEKSVDFLIDAHQKLVAHYPNCKLLIVGDGPDADHFKKQTSKLKITDNVIFTGKVPWEDIPKYYQLSTVFATASRSETQGLTLIEALASSLPIVVCDDDSFKIMAIDGLNGYIFKNKKEYIKSIESLIKNKEKLLSMKKQARISAEPHSSKYFAERILDVYKVATKGRLISSKKTFWTRFKDNLKGGLNGK